MELRAGRGAEKQEKRKRGVFVVRFNRLLSDPNYLSFILIQALALVSSRGSVEC